MSTHFAARVRRSIAESPVLQILLFIAIIVAVLLLAEYTGLLGA